MEPARIAELLAPFLPGDKPAPAVLSETQLRQISTYIDLLQHWNARVNLTAVRNEDEIVTRHFGESLFAARHLFPRAEDSQTTSEAAAERRQNAAHGASRGSVAQEEKAAEQRKKITVSDIGSGAGFPGIPIKLWAPEISLTLVESNHKKATFLREVGRALTLTDINIQNTRAETLAGQAFDVVTLRAVERFNSILPIAASLLAPAGRLALLIGVSQLSTAQASLASLAWSSPVPVPHSQSRVVLVGTNFKA